MGYGFIGTGVAEDKFTRSISVNDWPLADLSAGVQGPIDQVSSANG